MLESDPFSPLVYWPHVALGISSIFFGLFALVSLKGSKGHRRSGWAFVTAMGVAAITAIIFSFVRLAPAALFSSAVVLYGTAMALISLRSRSGTVRWVQVSLTLLPILIALAAFAAAAALLLSPPPDVNVPFALQITMGLLSLIVGIIFAIFALGDFRFLRANAPSKPRRYRRHAIRMALAVSEVLRAPLISFGPPLGFEGMLSFPIYFFGPFLLIPLIYFLALPAWLKGNEGDEPVNHMQARGASAG